jgi:hypothetical protein
MTTNGERSMKARACRSIRAMSLLAASAPGGP